jgi:protease IV
MSEIPGSEQPTAPLAAPTAPPAAPPSATPTAPPARRRWGGCLIGGVIAVAVVFVVLFVALPFAMMAAVAGSGSSFGQGNIALIRVQGVIASDAGSGQGLLTAGAVASSDDLMKQLKKADADSRIKAILLRVNSPGGSAAAGEEVAEAVSKVKKPVVVSISDLGASAAYMIASQADWIVATPASFVGSIGVILELPNYQGLYQKLGISQLDLHEGKYKDIGSPTRPMTPFEKQFLQSQLKSVYEQFIQIVARGRKMPADKVRPLATGLFWTGEQAKPLGLVDELGNYDDAVQAAVRIGHIKGRPVVVPMETPSFLQAISGNISSQLPFGLGRTAPAGGPTTR